MKPLSLRLRSAVAAAAALPLSILFAAPASADVKLPAVLADSMVLQQGRPVPVWGWADKGEEVTVTFAGQTQKATAGDDGKWAVKLQPLTASDKPAELTVAGKNTVALKDVLVGEVWVCSGQSNMEWRLAQSANAKEEIAAADFPNIRLFTVPKTIKLEPASDTVGRWAACSPKTAGNFSGVGYFFGRKVHQGLNVPVGLIHTSWGGTPAEAWTPLDVLAKDEELNAIPQGYEKRLATYEERRAKAQEAMAKWREESEAARKEGRRVPPPPQMPQAPDKDPNRPAVLYNGMVAPLVPFANRGSIWYQGESNAGRAYQYRRLLPAMIASWRAAFGDPEAKFLIVQLANFQKPAERPGDDAWAELREAQAMTAEQPNNGLAVAIDLADADKPEDIHPKNKQDVGRRLALVALGKYYGKADVTYAGPTYAGHRVDGDKVRITLKHADGLTVKGAADAKASADARGIDAKVTGFQIAGEDKRWHWADATIEGGNAVVVSSKEVSQPVAVRYAWSSNPVTNLYNGAGLPAHPFRTDDWPGVTAKNK